MRKNDESEKLVVKAICNVNHDIIVVSIDVFVEERYSLEQTPLEEPSDEEVVEVMPHDLELIDPISIKCPSKPIPTSNILPLHHCFTLPWIPLCPPSLSLRLA